MAEVPSRPILIMMQEVHCTVASELSKSHNYKGFYAHEEEKRATIAVALRADAQVTIHEVHAHRLMTIVDLSVAGRNLRVASIYIPHETSPVNEEEDTSQLEAEASKCGVRIVAGEMKFYDTEAMQEKLCAGTTSTMNLKQHPTQRYHRIADILSGFAVATPSARDWGARTAWGRNAGRTRLDCILTRGTNEVFYHLIPASKRPMMPTGHDILEAAIEWNSNARRGAAP